MSVIWKSIGREINIFVDNKRKNRCAFIITLNNKDTVFDTTSWISKEEALSMANTIIEHYEGEKDDKRK